MKYTKFILGMALATFVWGLGIFLFESKKDGIFMLAVAGLLTLGGWWFE